MQEPTVERFTSMVILTADDETLTRAIAAVFKGAPADLRIPARLAVVSAERAS